MVHLGAATTRRTQPMTTTTPESLIATAEFASEGGRHIRFFYQGEKDDAPRLRELRMGRAIEASGDGSWMSGYTSGKNGWLIERSGIVYIRGFDVLRDENGKFLSADETARPKCFRLDRVVF